MELEEQEKSKSWDDNPMGISAELIPPPCPKEVGGKGVVTEVIVDDPGNGFETPPLGPPPPDTAPDPDSTTNCSGCFTVEECCYCTGSWN